MTAFPDGYFTRVDESPDALFYQSPRKVTHIDDAAIAAVTALYEELIPEGASVLDLMSSWRSHLPEGRPGHTVGLGMNRDEMDDNRQLDEVVAADLNSDPVLPFPDATFDAVLCCVSVQYLVRPLEVFTEVARVLIAGGPFAVTFSNRCFPPKAVAAWLFTGHHEHAAMVRNYFERSPGFGAPVSEDRSPARGDPLYAVWARRAGAAR